MSEVELQQQTEAWLKFRKTKIGSSDAPIVMGVSPYSTPLELYNSKLGLKERKQRPDNLAIQLGNRFEPAVRAHYELAVGIDCPPTILVHKRYPFLMASLDGYNKEKGIVLEIKVAGKDVFEAAKNGVCHEKYIWQVYHQLEVSGADECHFVVARTEQRMGEHFISEITMCVVKRNEDRIKEMLLKELQFYDCIQRRIPPPLTSGDVVEPTDASSIAVFTRLRDAIVSGDKKKIKEVKEEAIEHSEVEVKHTRVECVGVSLLKTEKGYWVARLLAPLSEDSSG